MLRFCPTCANLLFVEEGDKGYRFACHTCPYIKNITRKISHKKYPKLKEVDDVLGGAAAWENVDSTQVLLISMQITVSDAIKRVSFSGIERTIQTSEWNLEWCKLMLSVPNTHTKFRNMLYNPFNCQTCPKCEHNRAFFMQIQTRSADEPMTTFYKCCSMACGHRWRD